MNTIYTEHYTIAIYESERIYITPGFLKAELYDVEKKIAEE